MRSVCASLFVGLIFAGSALAQDISSVKSNAVDNGTNTYFPYDTTDFFTVTGRVTSPFLSFTNDTVIFIQDASAGIRVESIPGFQLETNNTVFALGVQVTVLGKIDQSNGMRMIRPELYYGNPYDANWDFYISGITTSPVVPTVTVITNFSARGEDFEGSLIRINGLTIGTNAWAYRTDSRLTITDSTGTITLFINRNTDADGQLPPTNTFDLIGLASQNSTLPIPSNGYEIMPRSYSDFIQTVGQEPPSICILATNATAFVNKPFALYLVGQDRNAGDTLVLTTNTAPAGSSFTALGRREGRLDWTPGPALLNTTNAVVFRVTDGSATNTATAAIRVQPLSGGPGYAWINEFHYHDTSVTDTYEGVELAGSAGVDLSSYYLLFYSDQSLYLSNSCSGVIPDEGLGYGAVWFAISGIENSAPGGIALMHQTRGLLQFLSYEGVMMPAGGSAAGAMSVDVGISENPPLYIDRSIQLQGGGTNYEDFTWAGPLTATRGTLNTNGQYIPPHAVVAFTNLSPSPAAPHPNQAFHIVCTVTPNSTASNLSSVAWFRLSGGAWSNIDMTDQGQFTNRTVTQVGAQTNGTLVEFYAVASFIGPGTNSPMYSATNSFLILNHPPAFSNLSSKSVVESNTLAFTVTAGDVDSDFITLSISNVPSGAEFYPTNGTGIAKGSFVWTNAQPVGTYTAVFYAADADSVTFTSIHIFVSSPPPDVSYTGTVWINEFRNGGAGDVVELVVVSNNLNMQGMLLKDYSSSGASNNGGGYVFSSDPLWASVRAGTIIVLTNDASADDTTTGGSDYNLNVGLKNTTYFSTMGGTFDIATEEIIQLKGPGSDWAAGVTGAVHTLATAGAGTNYTQSPPPKLKASSGNTASGNSVFASNTTAQASDFNGTDARGSDPVGTIGTWNTPSNQVYILALRSGGVDVDGIPVSWWDRYGILSGERLATNNPDSDIANNYEEFVADTDPTNNASYFVYKVTNMTGRGTMQLLVGPPTTNSRCYDAWWITNLMNQSWTPYSYNVTGRSDGASFTLTVTNDGGGRFYRTGVKVP